MEMSKLTRDGTAEPVSQDQILRRERHREKLIFPVQLPTSRIGNLTRLIHTTLAIRVTIQCTGCHDYRYYCCLCVNKRSSPNKKGVRVIEVESTSLEGRPYK